MKDIQAILNIVFKKDLFEYVQIDKDFNVVNTSSNICKYVEDIPQRGLPVFDYFPELVGIEEEMHNLFIHTEETYSLESVCKKAYYVNMTIDYYDENNLFILLHDITSMTVSSQKILQYSNESILVNNRLQKILNSQNALLFCTYENDILYSNAQFEDYFCTDIMIDYDIKKLNIYQYVDVPLDDYNSLFDYVSTKEEYIYINEDTFILQATSINHSHKLFTLTKVTKLTDKMHIDLLTGAYNKSYFDMRLKRMMQEEGDFVVVVLDFDNFKMINDSYGHQVGDSVLKECSSLIKDNMRKEDIFARWGGEEFLLLLEYQNMSDIMGKIERVREIIAKHTFASIERLTVSFGVSARQEEDDIDTLLKRADEALYEAKESGKNKVIFKK
ncbi:MAG: GGDEF domain-containing protein [Sulfurovum sp.]|nr:GGDEF domain-containing protein [Sulfurovum sp.]